MTYKTFRFLHNSRRPQGRWPEQQKSSKSGDFLIFLSRTQTSFPELCFQLVTRKKNCTGCKKRYRNKRKGFLNPQTTTDYTGSHQGQRQAASVARMKFSFRRVFAIALKDWSWEISWLFYVRKIAWIISFSDVAMSFHLLVWSIITSCKAEWL